MPNREPYPVNEYCVPLPTTEIGLGPSCNPSEQSLHHKASPCLKYQDERKITIDKVNTLRSVWRNLESMQEVIPNDLHNEGTSCLHAKYDHPPMPTKRQMARYIWGAYVRQDDPIMLKIEGQLHRYPITDELMRHLVEQDKRAFRRTVGYAATHLMLRHGEIDLNMDMARAATAA